MNDLPSVESPTDPVGIFEVFNAGFGGKLLTAAAVHLDVFGRIGGRHLTLSDIQAEFNLSERAAHVLVTALQALGLFVRDANGKIGLTDLASRHLQPGAEFNVSDYLTLAADADGVHSLVQRLRTGRPAGDEVDGLGAQYIYREGIKSAMQDEQLARRLTLALAGRAKVTALPLVQNAPLNETRLLVDVAGGTGIFSIAYLRKYPKLKAIVVDLPEVIKVAREIADLSGVGNRLEFCAADMFSDPLPSGADAILLSNVLHDWDVPECRRLIARCAKVLEPGGRLLVHDAFLNDDLGGPLHIAIYSVILFYLTEGRAYSLAECRSWLQESQFDVLPSRPTMVHCSVLPAIRKADKK